MLLEECNIFVKVQKVKKNYNKENIKYKKIIINF